MRFTPPGPLGFGGAVIGNLFEELTDAGADDALDAAWRVGIRYYDTAPMYGLGLSEHRLGRSLRQHPSPSYSALSGDSGGKA
jgi:D-threo-aldose 1-dehydrogenase